MGSVDSAESTAGRAPGENFTGGITDLNVVIICEVTHLLHDADSCDKPSTIKAVAVDSELEL